MLQDHPKVRQDSEIEVFQTAKRSYKYSMHIPQIISSKAISHLERCNKADKASSLEALNCHRESSAAEAQSIRRRHQLLALCYAR